MTQNVSSVAALDATQLREALRHLDADDVDLNRPARVRRLQELLRSYGTVRTLLEQAPDAARQAFLRLVGDGPAPVEEVLGRGWWGRGRLPPPLDWLQGRGLVAIDDEGLLHATDEAREGFLELTLSLESATVPADPEPVRVLPASSVVLAPTPAALDRAVAVTAAKLRAVSPTVATSARPPAQVAAALRAAGVRLGEDAVVPALPTEPALPGTAEQAAGPRAIRALLGRAVGEARQVRLEYFAASRAGAATERVVDPWEFGDDLLRGYCHLRQGERTFAVDRIGKAHLLPSPVAFEEPQAT